MTKVITDRLTELEAAALGCVYRNEPCTGHFVRTQFRASPAPRFSDSAGSIYPTMKRLQSRRFLTSRLVTEGKRKVRYYECTAQGRKALKKWIGPPLTDDIGVTIDPLRTRMLSAKLLSRKSRARWLDEARESLLQKLEILQSDAIAKASDDIFHELAHANARMELETRLEWLELSRRKLKRAGLI